ncbi:MAG: nitrogen fixation protein NifQ, partial [Zoogloea sp.]|nr:nitrogen fixation protein NifQ [Zoogloea sp.]
RPALSALLGRHFPALAAKNVHNMRWKKFVYKQLCDRAEVHACRAPSCGQCGEYAACFMTPPAPQ